MVAFFVLSALAYYSMTSREWLGYSLLAIYGVGIEVLQWQGGYRVFELNDMIADFLGIGFCILCQPVLRRLPIIRTVKMLESP